jgi:hypothetical protein
MDTTRFDAISRLFANRRTRRAALKGGSASLAAAALIPFAARAQDGTPQTATPAVDPNDPHSRADAAKPDPEFLFVQPFNSGTWAAKEGEEGTYTLTLTGAAANTVYFSDRPERIVGLSPTQQFLDGLGFTPANPPNAALVTGSNDEQDILVIELLNPAWDGNGTLTYDARVLADYGEYGLAHLARQQTDYEMAESFSEGSLFIDDCSNGDGMCYQIVDGNQQNIGSVSIGECYDWRKATCEPCTSDGTSQYYGKLCAQAYPDSCTDSDGEWDCYVEITGVS